MLYFKTVKRFHLIAHSYGSYIALKMAQKLESLGKTGHITFIDGAPDLIKTLALETYKMDSDAEIQNSVIKHIFANVYSNIGEDFAKEVLSQPSWAEKVEKIVELSTVQKVYGKEYLKLMLNALVNRIKIILKTDTKISSIEHCSSTLLRPNTMSVTNISESYELDKNFKKKVEVIFMDGNHFSILENPKLVEQLNTTHSQLEKN